jgi:hypothetical protein
MAILVIHHRVRDFDAWKPVYDEYEPARREHGAMWARVYRTLDDPNDVVVAMEMPGPDEAKAFLSDPTLRQAMQRAGVEGEPDVHVREEVEAVNYA